MKCCTRLAEALCVMKENSEIFPHFFLDKSQLLELNGIDLPSQLKFLESYDIKSRLMNMPNLHDFDMDENLIHKVNSRYYDIIDFSRIKKYPHQLSLFHVNLRSLSASIDELHQLLNTFKFKFDIVGISETKEQISGFLKNVSINGYDLHSQYTSSAAGGVPLYIKSNLDYIIREDFSILDDDFETIWVEIKNKKSQNILCCCSYRHPNTEIEKFNKYIDKVITKITKENKLIFCMGDFNVNLLNYNTHNYTYEFMNNMISHYLLPHILHPTRVTDHSATVIDNIFSNNASHETVSGNIMRHIYHYFPQFIILNKTNIDCKRCSLSKRDFSKFDEQKFVDSFAGNNLDFLADRELSLNQKFDLFYQNLSSHVEHHAPSKK